MRDYELMLAFSPEGGDDGFPGALAQVSQTVANRGGEIAQTLTNPPWGHRKLAYPIRDYRDAYYAVLHLNLDPGQITSLERDLQLNDKVLRFIVVRRDDAMKAEAKAAARRPAPSPEAPEAEGDDDGEGTE
ncbi:MAG: 30S ribosomal protein S6 [Chloroflexi bacterium]|nr:30S ribosomal protein S6 [Chloroflexota bacterium]